MKRNNLYDSDAQPFMQLLRWKGGPVKRLAQKSIALGLKYDSITHTGRPWIGSGFRVCCDIRIMENKLETTI